MAVDTIRKGIGELEAGESIAAGRVRNSCVTVTATPDWAGLGMTETGFVGFLDTNY
jgi:hypothetical protein